MDGTGYTDCVALEQTHNSISAFEDEVSFFFPLSSLLRTKGIKA